MIPRLSYFKCNQAVCGLSNLRLLKVLPSNFHTMPLCISYAKSSTKSIMLSNNWIWILGISENSPVDKEEFLPSQMVVGLVTWAVAMRSSGGPFMMRTSAAGLSRMSSLRKPMDWVMAWLVPAPRDLGKRSSWRMSSASWYLFSVS